MTAIYNKEPNALTEQPKSKKPVKSDYDKRLIEYASRKFIYDAQLEKCRTILCPHQCQSLWEDGKLLEEGKDYELRPKCNYSYGICTMFLECEECDLMAYPLQPVQSEDENSVWNDLLLEYETLRRMEENTDQWNINILKENYSLSRKIKP